MARRKVEVFSLSFLDVICCGFGAVILFYTIISAQSGHERIRKTEDLSAEVSKLEEEVLKGTRNLVVLRNSIERTESETISAASRAKRLIEELEKRPADAPPTRPTASRSESASRSSKRTCAHSMKPRAGSRRAQAQATPKVSSRARRVPTADRRYITGLSLRGRRVLVLVDRSASMLSDDLVEIIRLRNQPEPRRREAAKWRRTLDIVAWVTGQLPSASQYQVYAFNTIAGPVLPGTSGRWLAASDGPQLEKIQAALDQLVPMDGTSLINVFRAARRSRRSRTRSC